jgi:hypothetical protein
MYLVLVQGYVSVVAYVLSHVSSHAGERELKSSLRAFHVITFCTVTTGFQYIYIYMILCALFGPLRCMDHGRRMGERALRIDWERAQQIAKSIESEIDGGGGKGV